MAYAVTETKTASLSQEFGEGFARRIFGDEAVDALPRFTRGPRKGKIKGLIGWKKCTRGGWFKTAPGHFQETHTGYVMKPGTFEYALLSEEGDYSRGNEYAYKIIATKLPGQSAQVAKTEEERTTHFWAAQREEEMARHKNATADQISWMRSRIEKFGITEQDIKDYAMSRFEDFQRLFDKSPEA